MNCERPSSSSCSSTSPTAPPPKRLAGRKKFRETRHPVYHGVRARGGGKWVCEVREPREKTRIWLGTFATPEIAARAHDVAAIALRGAAARLNFPDSAQALPRARSNAAEDVRRAAAKAAEMFGPVDKPPPSSSSSSSSSSSAAREADRRRPPAEVFVDEEALFNMPGLLDDMAAGLLMTPPAQHEGLDFWDDVEEGQMDLSLGTSDLLNN